MVKKYYIGVDGGATKCTVLLEDEAGTFLGCASSGPANIRISVPDAWQSIGHALQMILHASTITLNNADCQIHAGIGIAGCEINDAYEAFIRYPHRFTSVAVTHDAHTACLGAHDGRDGALIIAGTGTVGYQIENEHVEKVSGWGFPHDDIGSGAWLGLEAVKVTLQTQDGRAPGSLLADTVMNYFNDDFDSLVNWANQSNSTAFASLAPFVIKASDAGDVVAIQLLKKAAAALDAVGDALVSKQRNSSTALPCALVGGVAPFIQPYLSAALQSRLTPCKRPPEAGAIIFAKHSLASLKEKS